MAVTITTTLNDNVAANVAEPGDTLHYEVTITNSGTDPASGVQYNETHPGVTPIDATIKVTPIAFDDGGYTLEGNTPLTVTAASGVLANDIDPDGPEASLQAINATNVQHGSVVLNADGADRAAQ
jgi:uncharacterized repeat protein (TIGR01451 family)